MATKVQEQHFLLAEQEEVIAGFASILKVGYLDTLFVSKDHQGQGIAGALLDEVESFACDHGIREIFADVSITARPFFEQKGFQQEKKQQVLYKKVEFENFRMRKLL